MTAFLQASPDVLCEPGIELVFFHKDVSLRKFALCPSTSVWAFLRPLNLRSSTFLLVIFVCRLAKFAMPQCPCRELANNVIIRRRHSAMRQRLWWRYNDARLSTIVAICHRGDVPSDGRHGYGRGDVWWHSSHVAWRRWDGSRSERCRERRWCRGIVLVWTMDITLCMSRTWNVQA